MTNKSKILDRNLILLMCNLPWEWSTDYTNQTANYLAKKNIVICYMLMESYSLKEYLTKKKLPVLWKKDSINLYLYYPLQFLPFRRFSWIYNINQHINVYLIKIIVAIIDVRFGLKKNILWVFDPQFYPLYKKLMSAYFTLYDCVDYFSGSTLIKKQSIYIKVQETELLKEADLVVTISNTLKKLHSKIRKDIHVVPQGFRLDIFRKNIKSKLQLPHSKPIVGYVGGINFRLDYKLLLYLVKSIPQYNFIFIGPVQEDSDYFIRTCLPLWKKMLTIPNVFWYDYLPKQEIPGLIEQFDVGIIPYDCNLKFNRYCYPMKVFEYLYKEIPIISTDIEEFKLYKAFVYTSNSHKEWGTKISEAIRTRNKYSSKKSKIFISKNSWERKIEKISRYLT